MLNLVIPEGLACIRLKPQVAYFQKAPVKRSSNFCKGNKLSVTCQARSEEDIVTFQGASTKNLQTPIIKTSPKIPQEVQESPIQDRENSDPHQPTKSMVQILSGVELTPDILAIASVYFVQGVLGLSRLAVSFLLKDEFGLDPAERAVFTGISTFPWLVKPIYGFISDSLPLFGYRRRSYLILCGIIGAFSWANLALFVTDKFWALFMITLSSLSVAVSDVVVDSMVVERSRDASNPNQLPQNPPNPSEDSTSGSLQSLCWGSSSLGAILSAYFSGSLLESYGPRFVFGLTAVLPLITSGVGFLVQEKRVNQGLPAVKNSLDSMEKCGQKQVSLEEEQPSENLGEKMKSQLWFLFQTVKKPEIFLPTVFILVWQSTPVSDSAMFYFTTNELKFGPEFLGRVQLVTAVASLLGVGVFNFWLKNVPLRKIFFWTTISGSFLGMTQLLLVTGANRALGISDQFFAVGDSLVLTVLGQVSFMPVLVLAAKLCPSGVEATLFATLMSLFNGAGVLADLISAALTRALGVTSTDFENLALLVFLCNLSSLIPIPFLALLPKDDNETPKQLAKKATSIDQEKND